MAEEVKDYSEEDDPTISREAANPYGAEAGDFLGNAMLSTHFHFNAGDHPDPRQGSGYTTRFDWADGSHCTWLYREQTPDWLASRELPPHEGLFKDPYGNLHVFLESLGGIPTVTTFHHGHPRNGGSVLRQATGADI